MVRKEPVIRKTHHITWRSHEPSRLETFSDAVFAFALTLIIVSIEVPKSLDELIETMKGTLGFAACFAVLFQIWNAQNIYFRKYGLKDRLTTFLNGCLLFVVLVYAYPLKFLSMLLFGGNTHAAESHIHSTIVNKQTTLMLLYGAGYTAIYLLFYIMHVNAVKQAKELALTDKEVFSTKTELYINLASVLIGTIAMVLAALIPEVYVGATGFFYFLIPVAYSIIYSKRGKKLRLQYGE